MFCSLRDLALPISSLMHLSNCCCLESVYALRYSSAFELLSIYFCSFLLLLLCRAFCWYFTSDRTQKNILPHPRRRARRPTTTMETATTTTTIIRCVGGWFQVPPEHLILISFAPMPWPTTWRPSISVRIRCQSVLRLSGRSTQKAVSEGRRAALGVDLGGLALLRLALAGLTATGRHFYELIKLLDLMKNSFAAGFFLAEASAANQIPLHI